jgi:plastocyanin
MKTAIHHFISFLFVAVILLASHIAKAAIVNVNVLNYEFSPKSFSCSVGDTIQWNWQEGSHTTTSVVIPAGAAPWDHALDNANTSFRYKVTAAGQYGYKCTPHASMNMLAGFVVSSTGILTTQLPKLAFSIYPLPVKENATLSLNTTLLAKGQISIYNLAGQEVSTREIDLYPGNNEFILEMGQLKSGLYFVELKSPGINSYTVRIVKQ